MSAFNRSLKWIPTLYFAQGLPYVLVMTVSTALYKTLGLSNTDLGIYTSLLYLPWVIKPLWSPWVDTLFTRRKWVLGAQGLLAIVLVGIGVSLSTEQFLMLSLIGFWIMAFGSATNDIATDGLYMLALPENLQALFSGFRSTFYRIAMWAGEGGMLILTGWWINQGTDKAVAWSYAFICAGAVIGLLTVFHGITLPKPESDRPGDTQDLGRNVAETFKSFFDKPDIALILGYLLLFRLGESQLVKMATPFLLDERGVGGMALGLEEVGWINGTVGIAALIIGGIISGVLAAMHGLKRWFWPMALAMNLPNLAYVLLALFQPENVLWTTLGVGIEKFGYGFGFTGFMLYLIYIAKGSHKTAHYAFGTGFMALGMMIPGIASGWIQEQLGYSNFFIWVLIATLPGLWLTHKVHQGLDPGFGRKEA